MTMVSPQELSDIVLECEPRLEAAMRLCPVSFMPEGLRLKGTICGFASRVLAQYLREAHGIESDVRIGTPADTPELLSESARRHVLLRTRDGSTIDPTFGQFMALIGINEALAKNETEAYLLYPRRDIAFIPAGQERYFGERFAEFASTQQERLRAIRRNRTVVGAVACELDWLKSGLEGQELHDVLSGIWLPQRYHPFDPDGDSQVYIDKAVDRMLASE